MLSTIEQAHRNAYARTGISKYGPTLFNLNSEHVDSSPCADLKAFLQVSSQNMTGQEDRIHERLKQHFTQSVTQQACQTLKIWWRFQGN